MNTYTAELVGTAFFAFVVLAGNNAFASGMALAIAIFLATKRSAGGMFNPMVAMIMVMKGEITPKEFVPYVAAQLVGGVIGFLVWFATR